MYQITYSNGAEFERQVDSLEDLRRCTSRPKCSPPTWLPCRGRKSSNLTNEKTHTSRHAKPAPSPHPSRQPRPASPAWGFPRSCCAALDEAEYLEPTPIQAGLIPRALAGIDLMGQAQTGTGKTAAFCIPILERLQPRSQRRGPQALDPRAHPRVGRPGPRRVRQAGRRARRSRRGRLRRQADPPAGRAPSPRGRDRRRHARPRDGPDGPRLAGAGRHPLRGPRRGRPDAGHRLSARHRKDPAPLPAVAANAAA